MSNINRLDHLYGCYRNANFSHQDAEEMARQQCNQEFNPRHLPAIPTHVYHHSHECGGGVSIVEAHVYLTDTVHETYVREVLDIGYYARKGLLGSEL